MVSLDEWREARRAPAEADVPEPAPLRLLRLVVDGEAPPPFSLDTFLRRARAVMGETGEERADALVSRRRAGLSLRSGARGESLTLRPRLLPTLGSSP